MSQKMSKRIRKLVGFKVHRPRQYFTLQSKNRWGRMVDVCRLADQHREIYQLAKKVYKKSRDLQHVAIVVEEARKRMKA